MYSVERVITIECHVSTVKVEKKRGKFIAIIYTVKATTSHGYITMLTITYLIQVTIRD